MKDVDGLEDDNNEENHNFFITIQKSGVTKDPRHNIIHGKDKGSMEYDNKLI